MRSYSDWEEEKTKADTAITRTLYCIESYVFMAWRAVIETSLVTSFFLFFVSFFFFLNLFYSIGHELARIPCFLRFFFHFFFFFFDPFQTVFLSAAFTSPGTNSFWKVYRMCIYIYIYIRSIRTCGVHANRWWRWWPSVFNKLSDRCTCQIAMNQRMLLF